jgi:hypothetical protein
MNQLELGTFLRDEGAKIALDNAGAHWHDTAVTLAVKYLKTVGMEGALFEDVRKYAVSCGIGFPPSPNAWGAVALAMSKKNMIVKTGVFLPSKANKSHARSQPVWRLKTFD